MTGKTRGRMSAHERAIRDKLADALELQKLMREKYLSAEVALAAAEITVNLLEALLETKEEAE